jgi:hypothetical protein
VVESICVIASGISGHHCSAGNAKYRKSPHHPVTWHDDERARVSDPLHSSYMQS